MLALNANLDTPLAKALDVELLDTEHINVESLFHESTILIRLNSHVHPDMKKASGDVNCDPLFRWTSTIEALTKLKREKHVRKAYIALLSSLN